MKKSLLLLTDYQADYGLDGLHTGLYELEDWDVYEYPEKKSVHGGCDAGYDLPGQPASGLTGCGSHLALNPAPGPHHTKEEIFDKFPDFDLIVMGVRDYSRRGMVELCSTKGTSPDKLSNLAIMDEEDSAHIDSDLIRNYSPVVYFKRELLKERPLEDYSRGYGGYGRVMPLPFSAFHRAYPDVDDTQKELDLCLFLGRTWPIRDQLLLSFLALVGGHKVCAPERAWVATNGNSPLFSSQYGEHLHELSPWPEYMQKQAQSKITAVVRGFGRDTMHQFEAFSYETLVLYVEPEIYMPYPFEHRKHCFYIHEEGFSLLDKIVRPILANYDDRWRDVAKAGKEHCRRYHSNRARARYMVDISMGAISGEKLEYEKFGL